MAKTVHIFSNVVRAGMSSLSEYGTSCGADDIFVFLNDARLLMRPGETWRPPHLVLVHRQCGHHVGESWWFGVDETKTVRPWQRIYLRDDGTVEDINHVPRRTLEFPGGYPSGKTPTTGFWVAVNARSTLFPGVDDVVLVGFYGSQDSSTMHFSGHAWDFEETYLQDNGFNRKFLDKP